MSESEKEPETKEEQTAPEAVMTPPPTEVTTKRGRTFEFGRPGLKHRTIIMKVLKIMQAQKADYQAIIECAKARDITIEEFMKLPPEEFTPEEHQAILKSSSKEDNTKFADMMNEVLLEALFATVKKAPFQFASITEFEDKMDEYDEAVELFSTAMLWIALSAKGMSGGNRKN